MRSSGTTGLRPSTDTNRRSRRTIASFDDYADAQRAVDRLSDEGFPVERVSIVGTGLRYVEDVTGRLTTGRAALMGATQGAALSWQFKPNCRRRIVYGH